MITLSKYSEVNSEKMGNVIHGYLCNGNTDQIARQVNNLPTDNKQMLKTSSDIKKIEDVERIVWS
jgi:hypothetical protein